MEDRPKVPPGATQVMQINPYLIFNGRCAEAFPFYQRLLGGTIVDMQTDLGSLVGEDAECRTMVRHAALRVGQSWLMGCDAAAGDEHTVRGGMYLALSLAADEAERVFKALSDGGQITMPFEKTFWSPGFGMLVDRFGTPWMVSTDPAD